MGPILAAMKRVLAAVLLALVVGAGLLPRHSAVGEGGSAGAPAGAFVLRMPGIASDAASGATFDPGVSASGARYCRFLPGVSVPAQLAATPPIPPVPGPAEPPNSPVSAETSQQQLAIFNALWNAVFEKYVDPQFKGLDLEALGDQYEAKILAGLTAENFGILMKRFINELEDGHSHYQTPAEVQQEEDQLANGASFVGIGANFLPLPDGTGSVIYVLPGSPAEQAGIRPHDHLVGVNGGPLRLPDGTVATRGEPGTSVTVQIRRPGGPVFSLTMVRAAITAPAPVDSCLVAGTRIGYIFLPTFFDNTVAGQVGEALQELMAGGPLSGLIIDNRMNGGGLDSSAKGVLAYFTGGNHGAYVSRVANTPFTFTATPIGNSQTVPLVVLVSPSTVSFGEIFSGVLKRSGRATIIGVTTLGNVELLNATKFADGSRVWLAQSTFQPVGLPAGAWEESGIVADITVHGQWHEFTEMDDPALARAIAVLSE